MNAVRLLIVSIGLTLALPAAAQEVDWKHGKLGRLSPLIGTYEHEKVLTDPDVVDALTTLLPPEILPVVRENLEVAASIDFIAGHLVLSGNRAHHGGEEMVWVWLSVYDGSAKVVLLHEGVRTLFAAAERYDYLPIDLRRMVAAPPLEALYQLPPGLQWRGPAKAN